MKGGSKGLAARVRLEAPTALYIHCYAHRLNLALQYQRISARDVIRSITTIAIKEARIKEIKNELLNSEKLKSYFEENPREAQILRHDKELNVTKLDEHLRNVPDYIIPPSLRGIQLKNLTNKKIKIRIKNE
ncbi:unnamed protein product [Brachionus calyciflorus]|uniref:Uncharacterized protein n=1 Tax=Brachionus calyciflorus TaxID=104777 RepID=A0A814KCG7_9BILA|nr:unnamed protein product [Brachionus calyciflorus]